MSIQQMFMMNPAAPLAFLQNESSSSTKVFPTDAAAGYQIHSDGTIDIVPNQISTLTYSRNGGTWRLSGASADYEVRATLNSGSLTSGSSATGTWLSCSTTRNWNCVVTGAAIVQANLFIEIRLASSGVVQASCTLDLYAESTP